MANCLQSLFPPLFPHPELLFLGGVAPRINFSGPPFRSMERLPPPLHGPKRAEHNSAFFLQRFDPDISPSSEWATYVACPPPNELL